MDIIMIKQLLSVLVCALVSAAPFDPSDLPLGNPAGGGCSAQSLTDGSVLTLCEGTRNAQLYITNGSDPSRLLATSSSDEVELPTSFRMLTGYMCSIILHNNDYGQKCFDSAEASGLRSLLPGEGNPLRTDVFSGSNMGSTVVGQIGTCFPFTDRVSYTGLTPQAELLALESRNGKVMECDLTEFTPRVFMSAMWIGIAYIVPVVLVMGIAFSFIIGAAPYIVLCGLGNKGKD